MKHQVKHITGILLALALILSCLVIPADKAKAAKNYTLKTIDHSTTVKGKKCTIDIKCYYTYVQFKGDSDVIKKINKGIRNVLPKNYKNYKTDLLTYAKSDADEREDDDTYNDYNTQSVSFCNKKYASVHEYSFWYGGGVSNVNETGYVFDMKTGKRITKVTTLTKIKSLKSFKKALKKKIKKQDENYDISEIDKMKSTEFQFYITKKGKVCVCFGPYDLGFGGWTKKFYFAGDNL